ncbi:hypothetical protein BC938DRAFT_470863 [Jimgerdemannia flammicorona]|uniref:Suppressor of forked domain-containing protein n=1 Tax=Jimgerdemannia flammicorona TaxID=994334 RepID=A0A433Q9H0_9FUNG|nr:hypothetical protein BC938DRAFT_470863 [Jimgerdemannia flammicorona]
MSEPDPENTNTNELPSQDGDGDAEEQAALDNLELIGQLLQQLTANQNQYEVHIQLIQALRKATMFDELRTAREEMHRIFPLTEAMWLEWIEDEKRIALQKEEKARVVMLYKESVKDYLSIPIWASYLKYVTKSPRSDDDDDDDHDNVMDEDEDDDDQGLGYTIEEKREVFMHALNATQWHVPQSHLVWDLYRDFEMKLLKDMYLKRFEIPHETLDATFSAYSSLISAHDAANWESSMISANKAVAITRQRYDEEREPFERALVQSTNALQDFQAYLDWERSHSHSDPFAVRTLFERAVAVHCLVPALWEEYLFYLFDKFNVQNALWDTTERAVRNCPWSGDLWAVYTRVLEINNASREDVLGQSIARIEMAWSWKDPNDHSKTVIPTDLFVLLQRALSIGLIQTRVDDLVKTLTALCDYEQRRIDWDKGGPARYIPGDVQDDQAILGDVEKARKVWEEVVRKHGLETEAWLRYIEFERRLGNLQRCEKLFQRAGQPQRTLDWPERLLETWEAFEHEHGTIKSLHLALTRVRRRAMEVQAMAMEVQPLPQVGKKKKQRKQTAEKFLEAKHKKRANQFAKRAAKNEEKRKRNPGSEELEGSPGAKKSKQERNNREGSQESIESLPDADQEQQQEQPPAAEKEAAAESSKLNLMGPPSFVPRRQPKKMPPPTQASSETAAESSLDVKTGSSAEAAVAPVADTTTSVPELSSSLPFDGRPMTRFYTGQRPHAKLATSRGGRGGRGRGGFARGAGRAGSGVASSSALVGGEDQQAEPPKKKTNADFKEMFLGTGGKGR